MLLFTLWTWCFSH